MSNVSTAALRGYRIGFEEFGAVGTGKSRRAAAFAARMLSRGAKVIIEDGIVDAYGRGGVRVWVRGVSSLLQLN